MKLKQWDRVYYALNPLVEVVAQVRFPRVLELDDRLPSNFQREMQSKYPILEIQQESHAIFQGSGLRNLVVDEQSSRSVYHFTSADKIWRISLCSEFVALTCDQYEKWEQFEPRMQEVFQIVKELYQISHWTRLGLRYRDLIIREDIDLAGTPWQDLIASFLLASTVAKELSENGSGAEADVLAANSSLRFRLEDCLLNLRHGFVKKEGSEDQAYLIDADFYLQADTPIPEFDLDAIRRDFTVLHANAGALFRSCIKEELHEALKPQRPNH